jgi:hypothetical protein
MSSAKQKQKTVGFEFVRITRKAVQNLFLNENESTCFDRNHLPTRLL